MKKQVHHRAALACLLLLLFAVACKKSTDSANAISPKATNFSDSTNASAANAGIKTSPKEYSRLMAARSLEPTKTFELTNVSRQGSNVSLQASGAGLCNPIYYVVYWDGKIDPTPPQQINLLVAYTDSMPNPKSCDTPAKFTTTIDLKRIVPSTVNPAGLYVNIRNSSKAQDILLAP